MSLVSPLGPGGRLPSSKIGPSSEVRKTCVVIMMLSVEERTFLVERVLVWWRIYTRCLTIPGTVSGNQDVTS